MHSSVVLSPELRNFMKKHNIKLSRKEMSDLAADIVDAAPEVNE